MVILPVPTFNRSFHSCDENFSRPGINEVIQQYTGMFEG